MANIQRRNDNWVPQLKGCTQCKLKNTRTRIVPGCGNSKDPKIFFILDAVRLYEDETGRRFDRYGTELLNKSLSDLGLNRLKDCYTTSLLKCFSDKKHPEAFPSARESSTCMPYLAYEINTVKADLIILMGGQAMNWYFPQAKHLADMRGKIYQNSHFAAAVLPNPDDVKGRFQKRQWKDDWKIIGDWLRAKKIV